MAMDIATLGLEIRSDGVVVATDRLRKMNQEAGQSEKQVKQIGSAADTLMSKLSQLGLAIGAAFSIKKIADYIVEITHLAGRYEMLGVAMYQAGITAGYTSKQMDDYQKALQKSGIASIESRESLIKLTAAHVDLSYASKIARAAQDLAVVGGINSSEAFERMAMAIQKGQVVMLHTLGLGVTFEEGYKKMAKAVGRNVEQLTEQEKVQARVNIVLEAAAAYQGIYEKSMTSAEKQFLSMKRYIDNYKVAFGEAFQPAFLEIVKAKTEWYKKLTEAVSDPQFQTALTEVGKSFAELYTEILNTMSTDLPGFLRNVNDKLKDTKSFLDNILEFYRSTSNIVGISDYGLIGVVLIGNGSFISYLAATILLLKKTQEGLAPIADKVQQGSKEAIQEYNDKLSRQAGMPSKSTLLPDIVSKTDPTLLEQYVNDLQDVNIQVKEAVKNEGELRAIRQKEENRLKAEQELIAKQKALKAAEEAADADDKEAKRAKEKYKEIIQALDDEINMMGKSEEAQKALALTRQIGELATKKQTEAIKDRLNALMLEKGAMEEQALVDAAMNNMRDSSRQTILDLENQLKMSTMSEGWKQVYEALAKAAGGYDKIEAFKEMFPDLAKRIRDVVFETQKYASATTAASKVEQDRLKALQEMWENTRNEIQNSIKGLILSASEDGFGLKEISSALSNVTATGFSEYLMKGVMGSQLKGDVADAFRMIFDSEATEDEIAAGLMGSLSAALQAIESGSEIQMLGAGIGMAIGASMGGPMGAAIGANIGNIVGSWLNIEDKVYKAEVAQKSTTGTVLGADKEVSKSLSKSVDLLESLKDINSVKLNEIYVELVDLSANITGLVSSVLRNVNPQLAEFKAGSSNPIDSIGPILGPMYFLNEALDDVLGGKIDDALGKVFGGSKKVTQTGISFGSESIGDIASSGGINAQMYARIREGGGWFHSDDIKYKYAELDSITGDLFDKIFLNMTSQLKTLGEGLGVAIEDILAYSFDAKKLDLKGMTGDEISQAISAYFSTIMDNAVSTLFGPLISKYQRVDEGLMETAIRLISTKEVIEILFKNINKELGTVNGDLFAVTEGIADAFGGTKEAYSAISTYFDLFFNDRQKQNKRAASLNTFFKSIGEEMPMTEKGFIDIVNAIDITTEAGQRLFASLMQIAPVFDQYIDYIKEEKEALKEEREARRALMLEIKDSFSSTRFAGLPDGIREYKTALQEIEDRRKEWMKDAEINKLSLEDITNATVAFDREIRVLKMDMSKGIIEDARDIVKTAGMNDLQKRLYFINKEYEKNIALLEEMGMSTKLVERAWQIEVRNAIMEVFDEIKKQIDDLMWELKGGRLAPVQSAEVMTGRYQELLGKARSGKSEDISAFTAFVSGPFAEFFKGYGTWNEMNSQIQKDVQALGDSLYNEATLGDLAGLMGESNLSLTGILSGIETTNQLLGRLTGTQGYAAGGYYSDKPFFAGERGIELINPKQSRVFNAPDTAQMLSSALRGFGGGTTVVKVYVGDRELKDIMTQTLKTDTSVQDQVKRIARAA